MGGTTLSYTGKTVEEVLDQLRKGILESVHIMQPDSDVALVKPSEELGRIFKVEIIWENHAPKDVNFKEVEKGNIGMPIAVASHYGPKPSEDEWVGCVHLHT